MFQNIFGKKHHQAIRENDFALLCNNPQTITVAIQCEAVVTVLGLDRFNKVLQILRLGRVRMVEREAAVRFAEKRDDIDGKLRKQLQHYGARNSAASIGCYLESAPDFDACKRFFNIGGDCINLLNDPRNGSLNPILRLHSATKVLNGIGKKRNSGDHHLEAVPLGRIMRTRNGHTSAAIEILRCIVKDRSRHRPHIKHLHAGTCNPFDQCVHQPFARQTAITSHAECRHIGFHRKAT